MQKINNQNIIDTLKQCIKRIQVYIDEVGMVDKDPGRLLLEGEIIGLECAIKILEDAENSL